MNEKKVLRNVVKEVNACQCSNNSMDLNPHQVECNEGSFHSVELSQHVNHLDSDVEWLLHRSVSNEFVEEGLFLSLPFLSCPSVLVSDKSPSDVLRLSPVISTQLSVSLKGALSKSDENKKMGMQTGLICSCLVSFSSCVSVLWKSKSTNKNE